MTDERQHHIRESAHTLRLKTQIKRGTDTRDQETIEVKVRGNDPEEVVEKLNETIDLLVDTAETVRAIQPGEEDEDG